MVLTRENLMTLEEYSGKRKEFREKVLAHKKHRRVSIGEHANLYFEDQLTMQYQVQEMLRIEKIFEAEGIEEELSAYNPLIPDGSNWKATFMLEYDDVEERRKALAKMIGIEDKVWVKVDGHEKVFAIADEDLDREDEEKTSSVHFMRFELEAAMIADLKAGKSLAMGIDHPEYSMSLDPVNNETKASLIGDLA